MQFHSQAGRVCFALALIGSGGLQIFSGAFVRLVSVTATPPSLVALLTGGVLVGLGVAVLLRWQPLAVAGVLAVLLGGALFTRVPEVLANYRAGFVWTNPCKIGALLAGAALLAGGRDAERGTLVWSGIALGFFLVLCGVQHFVYADFVAQLVPSWVPGHAFWTYFTGVALMAGGLGINLPPTAGLAARLVAVMILSWVCLLHIPRGITTWPQTAELAGAGEALALAGTALLHAAARSGLRYPA